MPTPTNPTLAFECGKCMGQRFVSSVVEYRLCIEMCPQCGGLGKVRLTLDELAERIAAKVAERVEPPYI